MKLNPAIIKELALQMKEEITGYRRYFHQFPELSFEEHRTSEFIKSLLEKWGVEYRHGYAGTGLVASLKGELPGEKVIALRAEMDALPITEQTGLDYQSNQPGVMHACGHDMHLASMLGTIRIMQENTSRFGGTVVFIFQPGEEKIPGGASLMIKEGALQDPKPGIIVGQHVSPEIEAGKIGIKPGKFMASGDEIYIEVKGRGGHAALPDKITDTVRIAAKIIVELKDYIDRLNERDNPVLLSFGKVLADGATNVVPDRVWVEGTFRTMDEKLRKNAHREMGNIAEDVAGQFGGTCNFNIQQGYPALVNDNGSTSNVTSWLKEFNGKDNILKLGTRMTAEDFAYYGSVAPIVFYRLGVGFPDRDEAFSLHSSGFIPNEEALSIGAGTMAWVALSYLSER